MARAWCKVSAPGSFMMLGEHAVLHGSQALVAAVDRRVTVEISTRPDDQIHVTSALGDWHTSLNNFQPHGQLTFVSAAVESMRSVLPSGLDMQISADMAATVGLGTSAAVTAAVTAGLHQLTAQPLDNLTLHRAALETVHRVQGCGSGADLAASLAGGVVLYGGAPACIHKLHALPDAALFYCGYKKPTPEVVALVEALRARRPELVRRIYGDIHFTVRQAARALENSRMDELAELVNVSQGFMEALGVGDETLSAMIYQLRRQPGVAAAKISGSGLGDCVWTLGMPEASVMSEQRLPVRTDAEGVRFEES